MGRKYQHRAPAPATAPTQQSYGHVARDGDVHKLYRSLDPSDRHAVLEAIGVKWCQRIGHRHKLPLLRDVQDLSSDWTAVDDWLAGEPASSAVGDLFDPLITGLIDRGREILGDDADEPTTEHLTAMSNTLADERSVAQARLLLAAVVEFEFTAAPEARDVAAADPRFALPEA
jgi:hypothetical protein